MEVVEEQRAGVTTRHFVLDEKFIVKLLKRNTLKRRLIAVLLLLLGGFIASVAQKAPLIIADCGAIIGFLSAVAFLLVFFGDAQGELRREFVEGGWFSVPRWIEIDGHSFTMYLEDGKFYKNILDGLFKRGEFRDEYFFLQYASNAGMIVIPARAFESEADRQHFEQLLADKGVPVVRRGRKHEAA